VVIDPTTLLLALQFGDSAFPSGSFAFSWGLEGLVSDGMVESASDVAEVIGEQLVHRWHSMDRVLLGRAHGAMDDGALQEVDLLAEATTWSAPMRAGSRRAGRALLGVCARFGLAGVAAYRARVAEDARLGHLAPVQGLVFRASGLPLAVSELVSGWAVITSMTSAAVRLGVIGHIEALTMATSLRAKLAGLLADPASSAPLPASFTPLVDIAVARGRQRDLRMFAT
jgi:urease accessory protein